MSTIHDGPPDRSGGGPDARQPVRARMVTPVTNDHEITGYKFRQTATALEAWGPPKGDDEKPQTYPILPGHLSVPSVFRLRDLDADRRPEPTPIDTVFTVEYRPGGKSGPELNRSEISARDLAETRSPEWPNDTGIDGHAPRARREAISRGILAMGQTLYVNSGWTDGYACSGLIARPDGSYAFLRNGLPAITANGLDSSLICRFPDGIRNYYPARILAIDEPSGAEAMADDLAGLLGFLNLTPEQPEIALGLLCLLEWAPVSSVREFGAAVALLAGGTGSRKTAMCGVMLAAQSPDWYGGKGIEPPVTAKFRNLQSTVYAFDQITHPMSGLLALADDLFADHPSERDIAEGWKRLSSLADNVVTASGGMRGRFNNGRQGISDPKFPRSCVVVTAEELPNEQGHSSATARLAVFSLTTKVDLDALTRIQGNARATSRAHAAGIRAILPSLELPRKALNWGQAEAEGWNLDGHGRVMYGYARLLAGAYMIGQRRQEILGLDAEAFRKESSDLLRKAASEQGMRSGIRAGRDMASDPLGLFIQFLPEVLAGNPVWFSSPAAPDKSGHYKPPMIPGRGSHVVGWRQIGDSMSPKGEGEPWGTVVVAGETGPRPWRDVTARIKAVNWPRIHDAVSRMVMAKKNCTLPPADQMIRLLADAEYLRSSEQASYEFWKGASKARGYALDLLRVLDPEGHADDDGRADDDGQLPDLGGPESGGLSPDGKAALLAISATGWDVAEAESTVRAIMAEGGRLRAAELAAEAMRRLGFHLALDIGGEPAATAAPEPPEPERAALEATSAPESPEAPRGRPGPRRGAPRVYAADYAVIAPDGLHVPGAAAVPCPAPDSLGMAWAMATDANVRQLWIHPATAAALGLPDAADRAAVAKGAGMPHPWAVLPAGMAADISGAAPWVTVWDEGDGRANSGRAVVIPGMDDRTEFGAAPDGPALLAAVMLLDKALGRGRDFYKSPNVTMDQMARRLCRSLAPCDAIRSRSVPPAISHRLMIDGNWERPLTGNESGAVAVIGLDRNQSELSAMNTPLGIGEPEHVTGPVLFSKSNAGYYRIAHAPEGLNPLLPEMHIRPSADGSLWITRPDAELLTDLGCLPEITEAWIWSDSRRVLSPLYDRMRKAGIIIQPEKNSPAGAIAWATWKTLYKSFIGYLSRTSGPRNDDDVLWRPDYRDHIKAEAFARQYRNLDKAGRASGRYPVGMHADAVYYVTSETDQVKARPEGLTYGNSGGAWKNEGYALLADLDLDGLGQSFRDATEGE